MHKVTALHTRSTRPPDAAPLDTIFACEAAAFTEFQEL